MRPLPFALENVVWTDYVGWLLLATTFLALRVLAAD